MFQSLLEKFPRKKYPSLSIAENFLSGHVNIGPITIYGENAMHWAVNIRTKKWGCICFRLPFRCFGKWWPLYFYCSPNATPWAATFYIGGYKHNKDRQLAPIRRQVFGHNFSTQEWCETLQNMNDNPDHWVRQFNKS